MIDTIVELNSSKMNRKLSHEYWTDMGNSGIRGKRILTECNGCESYLLKLDNGAKTVLHSNSTQYEAINVREGRIRNNITGETYSEGDVVVFDKGMEVELVCEDGSYLFCVMGSNKELVGGLVNI